MRADTTQFHRNRDQRNAQRPERHHCPACGAGASQSVYDDGIYDCQRCGAEWTLRSPNDLPDE